MQPSSAGYSGTPLVRKLGVTAGARVAIVDAPSAYRTALEPLPDAVAFTDAPDASTDLVHVFATDRATLASALSRYRTALRTDAVVWVSWPKKAARVKTDITEDTIREIALPLGYVDVKVCAVDAVWSGLKLVVRRQLR